VADGHGIAENEGRHAQPTADAQIGVHDSNSRNRFAEDGSRVEGRGPGFDKVRGESVEGVDTQLLFHDEVFSTQNWLVRIYKRKKLNRGLAQLHAGFAQKKSSGARNRG
jgi:hypothetical protein